MAKIAHLERLTSAEYFKDSGLACIVREMHDAPSNETIAMHDHEFSELVLVASGSLNHIYSGGTVRLRAGDFFVIHPGERHGYAELAHRTVVFNQLCRSGNPPPSLLFGECPLMSSLFPKDTSPTKADTLGRVARQNLADVVGLVKTIRREEDADRPLRHEVCSSPFIPASSAPPETRREKQGRQSRPQPVDNYSFIAFFSFRIVFCVGFASPQGSALASLGVFASPWVANPPQGAAANADNNNIVEITKGRKVYFWDTGIRNAVIGNFAPVSLRQDVGALWENYLVSERRKALAYAQSPARCYFWRTTTQSEIDYIEESDGRFSAFEFKWNARRSPRMPAPFASAYPESSWTVVTHDDYQSFLTL